jgi:hypothetical protein
VSIEKAAAQLAFLGAVPAVQAVELRLVVAIQVELRPLPEAA